MTESEIIAEMKTRNIGIEAITLEDAEAFIHRAYEAGVSKGDDIGYTKGEKEGRRREAETWLKQNANQHDERIRGNLRSSIVEKLEGEKKETDTSKMTEKEADEVEFIEAVRNQAIDKSIQIVKEST